jgi:hypothetical protein
MNKSLIFLSALMLFAHASSSGAQSKHAGALASKPDLAAARPGDVASIESIVTAFYQAISAPVGGTLDRQRLNSLFVPDGRIAIGLEPEADHRADVLFLSPDEYAALSDKHTAAKGFFDRNLANQVERFGVMAHVYSTYESRNDPGDPKPMARGIKSMELLQSADRWYIVQVYWDSERPGNPIPRKYLRSHSQ